MDGSTAAAAAAAVSTDGWIVLSAGGAAAVQKKKNSSVAQDFYATQPEGGCFAFLLLLYVLPVRSQGLACCSRSRGRALSSLHAVGAHRALIASSHSSTPPTRRTLLPGTTLCYTPP